MNVVGVDFDSTAIHLVKVTIDDERQAAYARCPLPAWKKKPGEDQAPRDFDITRLRAIKTALPASHYWEDVHSVILEHPAGRYGLHSTLPLYGALCALLPLRPLVVGPSEWRTMVGLKGNATKDQVHAWGWVELWEGFGGIADTWPQDAWDAYAIARAGMTLLEVAA